MDRPLFAASCWEFRHCLLRGSGGSKLRVVVTSYHVTNTMFNRESAVSILGAESLTIFFVFYRTYILGLYGIPIRYTTNFAQPSSWRKQGFVSRNQIYDLFLSKDI